ncbi:MAG: pleC 4 [Gemmataceae bacterium]|nr:pleC 4 [Gemmataceae bacterium]
MGTKHQPPDRPVRVLLIDDDRDDYLLTRELLAEIPGGQFRLDHVPTYEEGLEAVCRGGHDVYLLDYRLGARTGLDLLREYQSRAARVPVIVLTGKGEYAIDREAMRAGAADYLEKAGLSPTLLERSIRYALQQHRHEAELEQKVRERTEALARANAALREEDRRKNDFIAMLAHELRNPLAPIRNAIEIMRLTGNDPAAVEQGRAMLERQVEQMVRLIDDLLDVSRITTGKLRVQLEPVSLGAVVEAAVEISRPAIEKAGLAFQVRLPDRPVLLRGDRVRLAQVFSNLLNNSAKYTPEGGIVSLTAEHVGAQVVVSVRDTGVGIPADVLPNVFDLFTQVDRTLNRSQGGLGIGLALVRRLVELHAGTVSVHSDGAGRGAEFTIRLPGEVYPAVG